MDSLVIGWAILAAILTLTIYVPIARWLHPRLEAILEGWRSPPDFSRKRR
ncbi:hypothetical protein RZN05_18090 [Sphingomonas sp. HF-S4]|uniref:Uncharacterized protein n=1 Tax=Sphingomonas agrestis TaxID=3080540 RepID=A0ABU3YBZ2_9SPHN|nr:hypothetical protein [Sphingomonas sp. HF-S4]MDV3458914.1 hypothetical protein [Sphingomonas sp. HF-S4]